METFLSIAIYSVLVMVGVGSFAAACVFLANALVELSEEPDVHH